MSINTERLRRALVVLSVVVSLYYIIWRLGTLNEDALFFSYVVYGAEVYGLLASLMFFYMVWKFPKRKAKDPPEGMKVDVLIPTYNEGFDLLRKTILGALNIEYPHRTYVLDDGNRPEVRRLCEELGCNYISRVKNTDGKAGNLNNALNRIEGDFIAVFDADHVPEPDFLRRTLGYFEDERVAFVQTPQDFYNVDSYEHRISKGKLWHEESLFYKVILRGKDRINSAFFCGSCAVIRRKALEEVGGFATGTVTEDIHTSIRIHTRGWKSVYHPEPLAYGVAPSTYEPYKNQRERWGRGAMQILFSKDSPLVIRGLSIPQRISYFASMVTYLDGFQKAVFYTAPAVVLFTGMFPISVSLAEFLPVFLPHITLSLWAFDEMSRGHGRFLFLEQYNVARFFTFMKSILGVFRRKRTKFRVTSKENGREIPLKGLIPQALVFGASLLGILYALINFENLPNKDLYVANMFWASLNMAVAGLCLFWTLRKKHLRKMFRFPANFPSMADINGVSTAVAVEDLHEEGAAILSQNSFDPGYRIRLRLRFQDEELRLTGRILHTRELEDMGLYRLGVKFEDLAHRERSLINLFNFRFLLKKYMEEHDRPRHTPLSFLASLLSGDLLRKRGKRFEVHIPGLIFVEGKFIPYTTEDVSDNGARILTYEPVEGNTLALNLGREEEGYMLNGKVVWSKEINFYGIKAYRYGVSLSGSSDHESDAQNLSLIT